MKRLVIFDLDGTLLDTIDDLALSCDILLKSHGFPTHSIEEYKPFVGNGIGKLVERATPVQYRSEELQAKMLGEFVDIYYENIDINTKPYDGVREVLSELQSQGIELAIASNKFQAGTEKLAANIFPEFNFVATYGQREGVPLKPHPQIVFDAIACSSSSQADEVLYVGDSEVDIATGLAAGVETIGVTWGLRTREVLEKAGATHIIDSPRQLLGYLK